METKEVIRSELREMEAEIERLHAIDELKSHKAWQHLVALVEENVEGMKTGLAYADGDLLKLGRLQGGVQALESLVELVSTARQSIDDITEKKIDLLEQLNELLRNEGVASPE